MTEIRSEIRFILNGEDVRLAEIAPDVIHPVTGQTMIYALTLLVDKETITE